jgi:hypothetical protein
VWAWRLLVAHRTRRACLRVRLRATSCPLACATPPAHARSQRPAHVAVPQARRPDGNGGCSGCQGRPGAHVQDAADHQVRRQQAQHAVAIGCMLCKRSWSLPYPAETRTPLKTHHPPFPGARVAAATRGTGANRESQSTLPRACRTTLPPWPPRASRARKSSGWGAQREECGDEGCGAAGSSQAVQGLAPRGLLPGAHVRLLRAIPTSRRRAAEPRLALPSMPTPCRGPDARRPPSTLPPGARPCARSARTRSLARPRDVAVLLTIWTCGHASHPEMPGRPPGLRHDRPNRLRSGRDLACQRTHVARLLTTSTLPRRSLASARAALAFWQLSKHRLAMPALAPPLMPVVPLASTDCRRPPNLPHGR